jgi:hypothetical protein
MSRKARAFIDFVINLEHSSPIPESHHQGPTSDR